MFLTQDRTLARKLKEVRLAQKIETAIPKDQILERYLNLIYLGSGAYGVADAAHAYFSKTPEELTLGEAATLAGVVPAPSVYSPRQNLELATRRRNEVLNRMAEVGFITPAEAQAAIAEPLVINPSPLKRFNREAEFLLTIFWMSCGPNYRKKNCNRGINCEHYPQSTMARGSPNCSQRCGEKIRPLAAVF
ncbi:transglycosylase domain-containing protein [Synechocystis sp. B12]|nr:transglycosylase domain-containing protein [Synechocystis sp. B12]